MDGLTRYYPHTRKEWAAIREQFTHLYQAEGKKLCEIVDLLGEQGFHAEEHHYKTYIRKWELNKKNKESDMIFAHYKIQQRRPKNTVFKIRGRVLTSQDIQHYWKRKARRPGSLPRSPSTPGGMEYRTPSPLLEVDSAQSEMLHDILNDEIFPSDMSLDFNNFLDFTQTLLNARRSPSPRLLSSPEPFRTTEQALYYSNIVIMDCVERLDDDMDPRTSLKSRRLVREFRDRAFTAMAAVEYHLSPINVEATWLDVAQIIPELTEHYNSFVHVTVLEVITLCFCRAYMLKIRKLETLGEHILHRISLAYTETHPLVLLLKAIDQSSSDLLPQSTRILRAGKDTLARALGFQHPKTLWILDALSNVAKHTLDINGACGFAAELYQLDLGIYETTRTDQSLFDLLATQEQLINCYWQLDYLDEAEALLADGLARCSKLLYPDDRDFHLSIYLAHQGILRGRRGRVAEGIESLNEALALRSWLFGAAEHTVTWIVSYLRQLEARMQELQYQQ